MLISTQMLNAVKMAGSDARKAEAKEREEKEKRDRSEAAEREAEKKRKAEEDSKKDWETKKNELESELRGIQDYLSKKEKIIQEALSKGTRVADAHKIKDCMTTVRLANDDMVQKRELERQVQEQLRVQIGKRHKKVEISESQKLYLHLNVIFFKCDLRRKLKNISYICKSYICVKAIFVFKLRFSRYIY